MGKDNIYIFKDLQGNEKECNINDPKYKIAEFEAMKSLMYGNESVRKLVNALANEVEEYKEKTVEGLMVVFMEVLTLSKKDAEFIATFFITLYEELQFSNMQKGVIRFLQAINEQSDQEFKEFIQSITEGREQFLQDLERHCSK